MTEAAKQLDPAVAQDLARLALDLSHDKKSRKAFGKIVKEFKPDSPHAAAFADVEIEDKFEAFTAAQEQKEIKAQQERVLRRMNERREALLAGDGGRKYNEDDVKKIEALMEKKGITDYDDGAILYAATLPPENIKPEREVPKHGATWELPDISKFGNPSASRDIAYQVIDEFQRKQSR